MLLAIAAGDLDDAESLTAAAHGVDGVFYMQLAPLPTQAEYMVQAARAAGVSKIAHEERNASARSRGLRLRMTRSALPGCKPHAG